MEQNEKKVLHDQEKKLLLETISEIGENLASYKKDPAKVKELDDSTKEFIEFITQTVKYYWSAKFFLVFFWAIKSTINAQQLRIEKIEEKLQIQKDVNRIVSEEEVFKNPRVD